MMKKRENTRNHLRRKKLNKILEEQEQSIAVNEDEINEELTVTFEKKGRQVIPMENANVLKNTDVFKRTKQNQRTQRI